MPNTLAKLFGAIAGIVAGWVPTTGVVNDIADGFLVLNAAHESFPSSPLVNALLKVVTGSSAALNNVTTGQLAVIGSETFSFEGYGEDEVLFFGVRKYRNGGAPTGSPAEQIKALNGY